MFSLCHFSSENVGYKTKNKRKSKPKKLTPTYEPRYGCNIPPPQLPPPNKAPFSYQQSINSTLNVATSRNPFLQHPSLYHEANPAQQFIFYEDSPGNVIRPGRPILDTLHDDQGYWSTTFRSFPYPFYEGTQTPPHSPKPVAYDREFESGKLQELQVSPLLCDRFNFGQIRPGNGNATDGRFQTLSRQRVSPSGGLMPQQQMSPVSSTLSTVMTCGFLYHID